LSNKVRFCRICGEALFQHALLSYENSPKSAQGFLNSLEDADDSVDLEIFQCTKCGLVQHDLPPVPYYKEVIRAVAFSKEMGDFRIGQLRNWIVRNQLQDKLILEVGCGKGEYLDLMSAAGAKNVTGLEFSKENISAAQKSGHKIYQGYLDQNFSPSADFKFDAFTIFSFLEHWPNPNEGLQLLYTHLSDGACGLVEVPNFDLILEKGLYSEFTTDHIFYFDKKTFTFLLEKNGFEITSIKPVWYDYILSAEVRKKRPLNVNNFLMIQEKVKSELATYIDRFPKNSVAVWGAGHQALAVIAMAKIDSTIKYILDSASFKQGKYTPATHLPIVSPDAILSDPPMAIIVMAAGYSSEVARIIEEKYPLIKNISILKEDHLEILK